MAKIVMRACVGLRMGLWRIRARDPSAAQRYLFAAVKPYKWMPSQKASYLKNLNKGTSSPPKVTAKIEGKDLDEAKARSKPLFEYVGKGNKGTLIVGSGERQVVAGHEFGDMLGPLEGCGATVGFCA